MIANLLWGASSFGRSVEEAAWLTAAKARIRVIITIISLVNHFFFLTGDKARLTYRIFISYSFLTLTPTFEPALCRSSRESVLPPLHSHGAAVRSPRSLHGPLQTERVKVNYVGESLSPPSLCLYPFPLIPSRHVGLAPLLHNQLSVCLL